MKRLLSVLLFVLLLTGCGAPAEAPTSGPAPTVTEAPTLPPVTEPEPSEPLICRVLTQRDTNGLVPFGDDLLIFSSGSVLTRVDAQTLEPIASAETNYCWLTGDDPALVVCEKGVTYYDPNTMELVYLDSGLKEVSRLAVPDGCLCEPALTADRKTLYYITDSALRALDLESGIDRLVREMSYSSQTIMGLHCADTILELNVCGSNGDWVYLYLSVSDGRMLYETPSFVSLRTRDDRFFATAMDGSYTENLTGLRGGEVRMLHLPELESNVLPILAQDAVITTTERSDGALVLDYFRLSDGTRPYSLTLPAGTNVWYATGNPEGNCVWFITYDGTTETDSIHRWNLAATEVADDTVYIGIRRTAENPDEYGLEKCARYAQEISEKYGVIVSTWLDAAAVEPWDYTIEAEYQVAVIQDALETLDRSLGNYPAGLLKKASGEMGDGKLRIGLVRALWGVEDSGALDSASGIQFWDDDGNCHISLQIGYAMESNLYHELYHVMESRIYSHSALLDNWNDMNPRGFSYDYEYGLYQYRDDYQWVYGDERAFIDYYCMTYPKEDRARIMEYAMMPENEFCFSSDTMQRKLRTLCLAIREAYDLETETEAFLWEQYLDEPIHAIG